VFVDGGGLSTVRTFRYISSWVYPYWIFFLKLSDISTSEILKNSLRVLSDGRGGGPFIGSRLNTLGII
jgi:hypothetical protein